MIRESLQELSSVNKDAIHDKVKLFKLRKTLEEFDKV
jgi:hypothetical protein